MLRRQILNIMIFNMQLRGLIVSQSFMIIDYITFSLLLWYNLISINFMLKKWLYDAINFFKSTYFLKLWFVLLLALFYFLRCFEFAVIFLFLGLDDYYYGGSMRDLSSRHGNRRKSSSASHIGKKIIMENELTI